MKISANIEFTAGGERHQAAIVKLNSTREISPPKRIHINDTLEEEDLSDQLELIKSIKHLNAKLEDAIKEKQYIIKLNDVNMSTTLQYLPAIALAVMLILRISRQNAAPQMAPTTIIQSAPPSRPATPFAQPQDAGGVVYPQVVRFGSNTTIA